MQKKKIYENSSGRAKPFSHAKPLCNSFAGYVLKRYGKNALELEARDVEALKLEGKSKHDGPAPATKSPSSKALDKTTPARQSRKRKVRKFQNGQSIYKPQISTSQDVKK